MKGHTPQKHILIVVVVATCVGLGTYAAIGVLFLPHKAMQAKQVSIAPSPKPTPIDTSENLPPISINIPKIQKNLPIKPATVHGNDWDMFPDAVAWLSTSSVPGKGNVILYAHDWISLWANLYLLKPGD